MRKNLLLTTILILLSIWRLEAQVGINTENPLALFHVDAQGDTGGSGTVAFSDDVVITTSGNMGIGTLSPSNKLEIISDSPNKGFSLRDTNQGLGKILTSDANGNGTWLEPSTSYAKMGDIPVNSVSNSVIDPTRDMLHIAYSGISITLPAGGYQLNFTVWFTPSGDINRTTSVNRLATVFFSGSPTSNIPPTYLSPIKSVIVPRLFYEGSNALDYYGSGAIPIKMETAGTLYLWIYMGSGNYNGTNRQITSYNGLAGSYGPYTQLYAIPFAAQE